MALRAISKTCRQRSDLSSRSAHRVAQRTPSTHTRRCATHDATFKTRLDCAPSGEFARLQGHVTANRPLKMTTQSVNSRTSGAGMRTYLDQRMRGAQGLRCSRSIRWMLLHVCARFRAHISSGGRAATTPSPRPSWRFTRPKSYFERNFSLRYRRLTVRCYRIVTLGKTKSVTLSVGERGRIPAAPRCFRVDPATRIPSHNMSATVASVSHHRAHPVATSEHAPRTRNGCERK